jgi:hypothetical protein
MEAVEELAVVFPEALTATDLDWCDRDMQRVDEVGVEEVAARRDSTTEADVLVVGGSFGFSK